MIFKWFFTWFFKMSLTENDIVILLFIQKYTFLTINQTVAVLDNNRNYQYVARRLRFLKDEGFVNFFGGHKVDFSNVPKVYYITEKGYEVLVDHRIPVEQIGRFKKKNKPRWSTQTNHRLHLVDVLLSLEVGTRNTDQLELTKIFLDYNRVKEGKTLVAETGDHIIHPGGEEDKLIPDGVFILKNIDSGKSFLFLLEMDMKTEGIEPYLSKNPAFFLQERMKKYDRYLDSGNYREKYKSYGSFDYFICLFVTLSKKRMDNIRTKLFDLPEDLHEYYFFNTYEEVKENFFNCDWRTRSINDDSGYSLLG